MTPEAIVDCKGHPVKVGARVLGEDGLENGTVIEVTESDADYDDNVGRAVQYGPFVHVRFDPCEEHPAGVEDRFLCEYAGDPGFYDPLFRCDDVEVAA